MFRHSNVVVRRMSELCRISFVKLSQKKKRFRYIYLNCYFDCRVCFDYNYAETQMLMIEAIIILETAAYGKTYRMYLWLPYSLPHQVAQAVYIVLIVSFIFHSVTSLFWLFVFPLCMCEVSCYDTSYHILSFVFSW